MNRCDFCGEDTGPVPVTVILGRRVLLFCGPAHAGNWLHDYTDYGWKTERERLAETVQLRAGEAAGEN